MERELILPEYYQEAVRNRPIDMQVFLSCVGSLIQTELTDETLQFVERPGVYYEMVDDEYGERNEFHFVDYILRFPDRGVAYLLTTGLDSYDMWIPWAGYEAEVGFEMLPLVHRKGKMADHFVSLSLIETNFHHFGFGTVFPIVDDFVLNLKNYLKETEKSVLTLEDYQLLYDFTLQSSPKPCLFPFQGEMKTELGKEEQNKRLYLQLAPVSVASGQ